MKKSFLITAIVLVLSGSAFAQTVLPLLPSAHGLTGNQPAYSAQPQQQTQEINFANGWNWWSSYVDLSDNGLENLKTLVGANTTAIKSQTQSLMQENNIWGGTLTSLNNSLMYMINTISPIEGLEYTAIPVSINDVEISTGTGWTWVGFPSSTSIPVNDAMANFIAENNNVIKSHNQTAMYVDGIWTGSLTTLEPGRGYMIYGNSQNFNYAPATRGFVEEEVLPTYWTSSYNDFATNMNIVAVINLMGEIVNSTNYEVGAFVGDDCRGSIVPMSIANKNIALLTINGNDNDLLSFRLLDKETGEMYIADNNYKYVTNDIIGTVNEPYVLYFNTLMSNDEFKIGKMDMFPNPVKQDGMLTLSIPALNKNMKVQVINSLGMVVKSENMSTEKTNLSVNLAPGVYTVKVVAGDKQLYVERLIVE